MDTTQKNGTVPSKIGLGSWPLGGDQWGNQEDSDSVAALKRAYEYGVTHFDTAQVYGRGHAEELLGKTLNNVRDKLFIATKILYLPKEKVENAAAASLRRLKTDRIDLLYIHWPKRGGDLAGMMEAMEDLRRKGIVRFIGVSNFSVTQMREVMNAGTIDIHQLCWNVLWRREEREVIPFCRHNNIGIVTYSSLAEGILTGKFGREVFFPRGDHRARTVLFEKEVWPAVFEAVERLKDTVMETGRPLSHCALQWLLSQEGVVSALAGCRTPHQAEENARSLENQIEQRVFDRMTEVSDLLTPRIPEAGNIFRWYP